jgi:hypothetical protein
MMLGVKVDDVKKITIQANADGPARLRHAGSATLPDPGRMGRGCSSDSSTT